MYNMCEVFMCMCKVGVRGRALQYCLAARQGMRGETYLELFQKTRQMIGEGMLPL
jgi:hypothetical protein